MFERKSMQIHNSSSRKTQAPLKAKAHAIRTAIEKQVAERVKRLNSRIDRNNQFPKKSYERLYNDLVLVGRDSTQENLKERKIELKRQIEDLELEIAKVKLKGFAATLEALQTRVEILKRRYDYLERLTSSPEVQDALDAQSSFYNHVHLVLQSNNTLRHVAESLMAKLFFQIRILEAKRKRVNPEFFPLLVKMQKELVIFMQKYLENANKVAKFSPEYVDLELIYEEMDRIMGNEYMSIPKVQSAKEVERIPTDAHLEKAKKDLIKKDTESKTHKPGPNPPTAIAFSKYIQKKSYSLGRRIDKLRNSHNSSN